jgi:spore maturation protein CgeB
MRILYIGNCWVGSTSLQRLHAIKELGHDVVSIDMSPEPVRRKERNLIYRIWRKFIGPLDLANVNKQMLSQIQGGNIDLIWIDKGGIIRAETLKKAKENNVIIAGYSPDDMLNPQNQSSHFIKGLPFYDIYLTTKSYNVEELKQLGCPEVEFIKKSFCPNIHRIHKLSTEDKMKYGGDIGFIGAFEQERAQAILYLVENGINVRVWGDGGWNKLRNAHSNLKIESKSLWAEEYAKALCSFKIDLCFLRKVNRDLHTQRSIEIPACGGFMLAERTDEHLNLFEEGKEAEYFSDNEELLRKVRYYLEHSKERELIAKAGYQRCIDDGYSNKERLKPVLESIYNRYFK